MSRRRPAPRKPKFSSLSLALLTAFIALFGYLGLSLATGSGPLTVFLAKTPLIARLIVDESGDKLVIQKHGQVGTDQVTVISKSGGSSKTIDIKDIDQEIRPHQPPSTEGSGEGSGEEGNPAPPDPRQIIDTTYEDLNPQGETGRFGYVYPEVHADDKAEGCAQSIAGMYCYGGKYYVIAIPSTQRAAQTYFTTAAEKLVNDVTQEQLDALIAGDTAITDSEQALNKLLDDLHIINLSIRKQTIARWLDDHDSSPAAVEDTSGSGQEQVSSQAPCQNGKVRDHMYRVCNNDGTQTYKICDIAKGLVVNSTGDGCSAESRLTTSFQKKSKCEKEMHSDEKCVPIQGGGYGIVSDSASNMITYQDYSFGLTSTGAQPGDVVTDKTQCPYGYVQAGDAYVCKDAQGKLPNSNHSSSVSTRSETKLTTNDSSSVTENPQICINGYQATGSLFVCLDYNQHIPPNTIPAGQLCGGINADSNCSSGKCNFSWNKLRWYCADSNNKIPLSIPPSRPADSPDKCNDAETFTWIVPEDHSVGGVCRETQPSSTPKVPGQLCGGINADSNCSSGKCNFSWNKLRWYCADSNNKIPLSIPPSRPADSPDKCNDAETFTWIVPEDHSVGGVCREKK